MDEKRLITIIRGLTGFYIFSLIFFGVTAFPIESELRLLCQFLNIQPDVSPEIYSGMWHWLAMVQQGVIETNAKFPFLLYGTDWLAFSHIVIAVAFIGLYVKPVRNKWIVYFGIIACLGVVPLALIAGAIRGIPWYWRMIDSSFSIFGVIPLLFLHKYINRLEKISEKYKY